jgi:electron transport complex protein RnfG
MVVVLATVALVSATGLVLAYKYAQPKIVANQQKELEEAILRVLPNATSYETVEKDGEALYVGKDRKNRVVGYAVVAKGSGYQGEIVLIAGLDQTWELIFGIAVLASVETPGLGGMIASDDFRNQFLDVSTLPEIELVKDAPAQPNEIQAITGATISSRAVVNILNEKIATVRNLLP